MTNDEVQVACTSTTVGELKAWLANLPDQLPIILSKDAEGNDFSPLCDRNQGWYIPTSPWSGESWAADDDADDEDCIPPDDALPALFLWPVN